MGKYLDAEVCTSGHPTTSDVQGSPERTSKYCGKCGAETLRNCPECQSTIRGRYYVSGVVRLGGPEFKPPSFCHSCGSAFPWLSEKLMSANELIDELDNLSDSEKEILRASIIELTKETARTELAAVRVKKFLSKAGGAAGNALTNIVVGVATAAAQKHLGVA